MHRAITSVALWRTIVMWPQMCASVWLSSEYFVHETIEAVRARAYVMFSFIFIILYDGL